MTLIEKLPTVRTPLLLPAAMLFAKGEVIADSRGTGSQQQVTLIGS